jgi:hypothetical protein
MMKMVVVMMTMMMMMMMRKPAPVPLFQPQIPQYPTYARTRAASVGSRRLTT